MQFQNRNKIKNWRIDPDGFLTVTVSVLTEGVWPYKVSDLEGEIPEELKTRDEVGILIPSESFTPEALKTLEGKPATVYTTDFNAHEWRNPDNTLKDGLTVGSAAGEAWIEGNRVLMNFLIQDKETIERIKSGDLVEVSAGYCANLEYGEGDFNGLPFVAKQGELIFNHVLFLPKGEGRLGDDAKILNKKRRNDMSHIVKTKARTYRFTNEADRAEAEKMANEMAEDVKQSNSADMETTLENLKNLQEEVKCKNEEIDSLKAEVQAYADKLADALNPEAQEALAQELIEQAENEEEVLNAEVDESDKEEVKNQIKNAKVITERRKVLVSHIMNKRGVDTSKWTKEAIDGAFSAFVSTSIVKNKKVKEEKVPMANAKTTPTVEKDPFSRMMSFKNKKGA